MNNLFNKRTGIIFIVFLVSVAFSLLNLHLKLEVTPAWFSGILEQNHNLLLDFNYTNNEQSRLFQFYIPEFFHQLLGTDVKTSYALQRVLFTTLTFFLFFFFCKKWFNNLQSFLCLVALTLILPITYENDLQESSSLLSLTFLCALWAIRQNKDVLFAVILLIGSINNETMLFLPLVYFFVNYRAPKIKHLGNLALKTVLLAFPAYLAVGIIRYINIDRPHLGGAWHFYENMQNLNELLLVFNFLWILAFVFFKRKPVFLQRCLLTVPIFILPHLLTGIISETRQMVPLAFIIIPSSLFALLEIKKVLSTRLSKLK